MNIFEALDQVESPVEEPPPLTVDVRGHRIDDGMAWMLWNVALAKLSGYLEESTTLEELRSAIDYSRHLYNIGVLTNKQVQGEVRSLVAALIAQWEQDGCPVEPSN